MIKVSDYIADFFSAHGIRHVFMVTGGGAMHLNHSLGTNPQLTCIFNQHEQACAMAAESYARLSQNIAVVCVTTGPGGTNALTGVWGAWVDSVPMFVISGQVRFDTTVSSTALPLRQLGDQEIDIVALAAKMTKYATMVTDPQKIRYHLEKALYLARVRRPGPVWLDIPMNVQSASVDENSLVGYDIGEDQENILPQLNSNVVREIVDRMRVAKRPVILAGNGIRIAGAVPQFLELIKRCQIPVVTAWNAHDLIPETNPFYVGRPGTVGDRAGNYAVQNSDLLLVLGCRLNIRQISYNWAAFARAAFKIIVDIDAAELQKPTVKPDLPVWADVAEVIQKLLNVLETSPLSSHNEWVEWCVGRKLKYPVVLPEYWEKEHPINPYCFMRVLSDHLPERQVVVAANGTACVCAFQTIQIKPEQRLYTNSGCASMGYDLPAAIGAAMAAKGQSIICLAGDGSLQMNLAELQTIVHYKLPIKMLVLNNCGYHSIRQTQENFFGATLVGCDDTCGVSFPNLRALAAAYQIPFVKCDSLTQIRVQIEQIINSTGSVICEVILDPSQPFAPKVSSQKLLDGRIVSKPLEDLFPFLPREEFLSNMLIPALPEG